MSDSLCNHQNHKRPGVAGIRDYLQIHGFKPKKLLNSVFQACVHKYRDVYISLSATRIPTRTIIYRFGPTSMAFEQVAEGDQNDMIPNIDLPSLFDNDWGFMNEDMCDPFTSNQIANFATFDGQEQFGLLSEIREMNAGETISFTGPPDLCSNTPEVFTANSFWDSMNSDLHNQFEVEPLFSSRQKPLDKFAD